MAANGTENLEKLLSDFYVLTGMKICVFDAEGNELCYYPKRYCHFCDALRRDGAMAALCERDDRQARAACAATGREMIYTCHAGLTECIAPILTGGVLSGYIMIGQIRAEGTPAASVAPLPAETEERYARLPVVPMEKIRSALHIVRVCAEYDRLKAYLQETTRSFPALFACYVSERIGEDIGVTRLMRDFHLSRAELYKRVREGFGMSPAAYIREQRLLAARRCLAEGRLPVGEVAKMCGFCDYTYFSKLYRKRFHETATAAREGAREGK